MYSVCTYEIAAANWPLNRRIASCLRDLRRCESARSRANGPDTTRAKPRTPTLWLSLSLWLVCHRRSSSRLSRFSHHLTAILPPHGGCLALSWAKPKPKPIGEASRQNVQRVMKQPKRAMMKMHLANPWGLDLQQWRITFWTSNDKGRGRRSGRHPAAAT